MRNKKCSPLQFCGICLFQITRQTTMCTSKYFFLIWPGVFFFFSSKLMCLVRCIFFLFAISRLMEMHVMRTFLITNGSTSAAKHTPRLPDSHWSFRAVYEWSSRYVQNNSSLDCSGLMGQKGSLLVEHFCMREGYNREARTACCWFPKMLREWQGGTL